jgi:hypothetical protein
MKAPAEPTPYRISIHTGGAVLSEWSGDALGYMPRAVLSAETWQAIGPALQSALTTQRQRAGQRRGRWGTPIALSRYEGKEALLLFWGAERATADELRAVIANWRGLAPEERWWLVSQADATRGRADYDPRRGWRQAIYHILVENPV